MCTRTKDESLAITIVSITHYMEEAAQADRVLVMSRGRIVMEGTPEQVFSQTERLHGYHLDVPQAAELRDELVKAVRLEDSSFRSLMPSMRLSLTRSAMDSIRRVLLTM